MLLWLVACSQSSLTPTDTGDTLPAEETGDPGTQETGEPCGWEGIWQITSITCDDTPMDFIPSSQPTAMFEGSADLCALQLRLYRLVDSAPCEIVEDLELARDESAWTGSTLDGSDEPSACFGAHPGGYALGAIGIDVSPDGLRLDFDAPHPWSLSECAGTATLRISR